VRGRVGNDGFGAGGEGDRDDDVVKGEGGVLEFVFEVDGHCSGVGIGPAVDCE